MGFEWEYLREEEGREREDVGPIRVEAGTIEAVHPLER
jgi:hypothetical protein